MKIEAYDLRLPSGKTLQKNLNFSLRPRSILFVQGPNGSGKSTLLRSLASARPDITYLPQSHNQNLHLPYQLQDIAGRKPLFLEESELTLLWNTASGGQKQRTLLSWIFSQPKAYLFLDEPTNHLDQKSQQLLEEALRQYLDQGGSALIASHQWTIGDHPILRLELSPEGCR